MWQLVTRMSHLKSVLWDLGVCGGEGQVLNSGNSKQDPTEAAKPGSGFQKEGHSVHCWKKGQRPLSSQARLTCRLLTPLSVASLEHTSPSLGNHWAFALELGERSKLRLPWADS